MLNGKKVLIVDDDQVVLDLYKERFQKEGLNAEISLDGEDALRKIHAQRPDIILLDIMMPKFNGYDLLTSLKSDPQTKDIPVIVLTALMRDINKTRALEAGADDYIIKSEAMPEEVIKKIEQALIKLDQDHIQKAKLATFQAKPAQEGNVKPPETPASDIINFEPAQSKPENTPQPTLPKPEPVLPPLKPLPKIPNQKPPEINSTGFIAPAKPRVEIGSNKPQNLQNPHPAKKLSGVIIFCLILIIILILISDVFFYLMLIANK